MLFRKIQLWLSVVMVLAGLVLIFVSVAIPPAGEIHASVLVAFGEALTFAGSVLGIDYRANSKNHNS